MDTAPRTAYILQVHKNPNQVNQFIQQLISEEQADVYVHVDQKNYEKFNGKLVEGPNVKVLETRVNCEWGDISQVDTTILLLREVLASKNHYDFVCLRSGQDLLVKNGFKDFLLENKDKVFLNLREMNRVELGFIKINWPKGTRKQYTSAHPFRMIRRLLLILHGKGINILPNTNKWPDEYLFYRGSQWFTIPFEVAKYSLEFLDKNDWFYEYFKNTLVPDESFFHTLIMNSPYKTNVVNNNLYFMKWGETLSERNSPQSLTSDYIGQIEKSNQYFARKFDEKIDGSIINYFVDQVSFGTKTVNSTTVHKSDLNTVEV